MPSATIIAAGPFVNNLGTCYDPGRDTIWAVTGNAILWTFDSSAPFDETAVSSLIGSHDGLACINL